MHTVYVLKSLKDSNLYIGCTSDVQNRLKMHNSGKVRSTRKRHPFVIMFQESFNNKYDAYKIERFYKTANGKRILTKKMSASSLQSCGIV